MLISLLLWLGTTTPLSADEPYYLRDIWLDPARQRHVNVRLSFTTSRRNAKDLTAQPLLLFSMPQGWRWGGYQDQYEYLAAELAQRGLVMVTIGHYHIDETTGKNETFSALYPGIQTGTRHDASVDRYEDMRFVLRELARINARQPADWPILDLDAIAVGGHSSGVLTALHLCGLPVRDKRGQIYTEQRAPQVKSFVIMGYPKAYSGPSRRDLQRVQGIAGLHIVGSQDAPAYRNTSYRYIGRAPQYWLVVTGGHGVGSIGPLNLLREIIGTFISGYMLSDYLARDTLHRANLNPTTWKTSTDQLHVFEKKPAPSWRHWWDRRDLIARLRTTLPWGIWLHDRSIAYYRDMRALAK